MSATKINDVIEIKPEEQSSDGHTYALVNKTIATRNQQPTNELVKEETVVQSNAGRDQPASAANIFASRLFNADINDPATLEQKIQDITKMLGYRHDLEELRHKLVKRMLSTNPQYKPPADYKVVDKVMIPQDDYPELNFVGKIIGRRGCNIRKMQKDTGANIILRGKPLHGQDGALHAHIAAANPEKVKRAAQKMRDAIQESVQEVEYQRDLHRRPPPPSPPRRYELPLPSWRQWHDPYPYEYYDRFLPCEPATRIHAFENRWSPYEKRMRPYDYSWSSRYY